jgi:hypothetical protein
MLVRALPNLHSYHYFVKNNIFFKMCQKFLTSFLQKLCQSGTKDSLTPVTPVVTSNRALGSDVGPLQVRKFEKYVTHVCPEETAEKDRHYSLSLRSAVVPDLEYGSMEIHPRCGNIASHIIGLGTRQQ